MNSGTLREKEQGMSFSSSGQLAVGAAARVLRGPSVSAMAKTVGVVVGGGVLAATYNLMNDEAKTTVKSWRTRRAYRLARHEAILAEVMGSALHAKLQEQFLHSRNAFKIGLELLANDLVKSEDKAIIRGAIQKVQNGDTE